MTVERWRQIEQIFHDTDELEPEQRAAYLTRVCDGDTQLYEEVERLLATAGNTRSVVDDAVAETVADVLATPERLGPYEILQELKSGGMGVVYLARRADRAYDQQVAIKVIRPALLLGNAEARFRAERQILANLIHPNIARLLDGGTTPAGQPYLVMEYVSGEPIDEWCRNHASTQRQKIELIRAVCAAVQCAHQNLIVHRDLKPANILVTADGTPKLLDFGIAKLLDPGNADSTAMTRATEPLMTPEYASPEQLLGQPVTTETDVYALGLLLFELLTGERPPSTPVELPRPSTRVHSLRGELDNIVLKAAHREVSRRYGSAAELSEDLRRYLEGLPVKAQPDSWTYRTGKFVKRRLYAVAAAAVLLLALIGFSVAMSVMAHRAQVQRDRATRVSQFLVQLFKSTDPDSIAYRNMTARDMLARGVKDIDQLARVPQVQADLLETFGTVYQSLGDFKQSREMLRRSLSLKERFYGKDSLEVAQTLKDISDLARLQFDYTTSEQAARRSLAIRRRILGEHSTEVAETENSLALALQETGGLREAEALFQSALAERNLLARKEHLETAVLSNLGAVYRDLGDLPKAEQYLSECVAIRRATLGPTHPRLALALSKLSLVQEAEGQFSKAEASLREALEIRRISLGPNHPDVIRSLINLSALARKQGRYPEAESLLKQAEARRGQPGSEEALSSLSLQRGLLLEAEGEPAQAEKAIREYLASRIPKVGEKHISVARARIVLARLDLQLGKDAESRQQLEAAAPILMASSPVNDPDRKELQELQTRVLARR